MRKDKSKLNVVSLLCAIVYMILVFIVDAASNHKVHLGLLPVLAAYVAYAGIYMARNRKKSGMAVLLLCAIRNLLFVFTVYQAAVDFPTAYVLFALTCFLTLAVWMIEYRMSARLPV